MVTNVNFKSKRGLTSRRFSELDKLVNRIDMDVKIFIDGNNLYLNCLNDSKEMLLLFKTARDLLEAKKSIDNLLDPSGEVLNSDPNNYFPKNRYSPDIFNLDYTCTPRRVAQAASLYINKRLINIFEVDNFNETIAEFLEKQNLDINPKDILIQPNFSISDTMAYASYSREYSIQEKNYLDYVLKINSYPISWISQLLTQGAKDEKFISSHQLRGLEGKKKKDYLTKKNNFYAWLIETINSLTNSNLMIKKSNIVDVDSDNSYAEKIHQYLNSNKSLQDKLIDYLFKLDLNDLDKKYLIRYNYSFNIHKAISSRKSITERDRFYKELQNLLSDSKIINGKVKFNESTRKEEEKEVDVAIAMLATKHMMKDNTVSILLTNDSDFGPLLDLANEDKNIIRIASVTRKDRIAKRFRESNKILILKEFMPNDYLRTWFKNEINAAEEFSSYYMVMFERPLIMGAIDNIDAQMDLESITYDTNESIERAEDAIMKSKKLILEAKQMEKTINRLAKGLFGENSTNYKKLLERAQLDLIDEKNYHQRIVRDPLMYDNSEKIRHKLAIKKILAIINKYKN